MAIQAQLNHNASNASQTRFQGTGGGSEFSLINNNGGTGSNNNLQLQKDFNQQALFHNQRQQYRSQSFLDAHMEKQRQEIDQLIRIQNERLMYVLQEQRNQEMKMILKNMETKVSVLMAHKDDEMSQALSKNMGLQDMLRKMEMENQTLRRIARENEAMVATLNSTLVQVRERAAATCHNNAAAAEDEGSFCGGDDRVGFPGRKMSSCCLNCGSNGVTRVLFLPCRHLCCCTDCEAGLVLCPICSTPKKNRIEAIIF